MAEPAFRWAAPRLIRAVTYGLIGVLYAGTWTLLWPHATAGLLATVTASFGLLALAQALSDSPAAATPAARRVSLALQLALSAALTWLVPGHVTMILYFVPVVRAFTWLAAREAAAWSLGLAVLVTAQHLGSDGLPDGLVIGLAYGGGFALFGAAITALRQAEDRTRELSALLAVSRAAASTLEMEPLMGLVLDHLRRVVDYAAGSVRLIEGDELVLLAYRGAEQRAHWARGRSRLDQSPAVREVVRRRAPLIVGDFRVDEPALLEDFRRARAADLAPLWGQLRSWMGVPLIVRDEVLGAIVISHGTPGFYTSHHAELALAVAGHAAAAVQNARLYARSRETAARQERSRLARELHDAVTQTLFSASLIADVLPRLWERNPDYARRRLDELRQLVRGALAEMRTLLLELRPAALTQAPLGDLLGHLADAFTGRTLIPVSVEQRAAVVLPPEVQVALYRIAQEALHNVAKHAAATRVALTAWAEPDRAELRIADDGAGFDPTFVSAEHLGLRIMRERADAIGAAVRLTSGPGQGTTVHVTWPAAARPAPPAEEGAHQWYSIRPSESSSSTTTPSSVADSAPSLTPSTT
ncbi:MAG TPA: GAF domain-containing sensor histidine kinase [Chloroflexota bacterium]|nr:GAF domain-containing sensor histidine kinase [Chloroflexota bacterium]